ncbi:MAG: TldD/PmbA family protein [Myxococcota bacterium]
MSSAEGELLEHCREGVRRALDKGADQAEVFAVRSAEVRVQVEADDLSIARSDDDEGFGIRVRRRGVTGFASTNDGGRASLDEATDAALALARVSPADPRDDLPEADGPPPRPVDDLWDPAIAETEVDAVARRVGELAERVHEVDARVRLDSGWIGLETAWTALASSTGVEVSERTTGAQALLMGMAVEGERVGSFDHEVVDVCSLAALEGELRGLPERFAERVLSCLAARPGESFQGTLVLAPEAVAGFLLPPLASALSGQAVRTGRSRLAKRLGERIAGAGFGLCDDARLPGRAASGAFDREGTPARPLRLIDGGELRAFLYNTREARAAGRPRSTGHARGGARSAPGIGPSNLVVDAGDLAPADLFEGIDRGILLRRFSGNTDPVSGDFSGVAKSSFLLRREDSPQPVQETLVSGNVFELLSALSGVGRERSWIDGCVQAPLLRFEGVSVTAG